MPRLAIRPQHLSVLIFVVAMSFALVGARPYAGSWNDGSRLAAVESLVERGTLAIDDSVFVHPSLAPSHHPPYPASDPALAKAGTQDRLFIRGHFHSDKTPILSVVMACCYAPGYRLGLLPSPSARPDQFTWLMTLQTSVLSLAVALVCLHYLGKLVGLDDWTNAVWLAAFAFATFALGYTRHVNSHVMQLAVVAGWCLMAARIAREETAGRCRRLLMLGMGALLGFGYNLDLASGPLLLVGAVVLVLVRTRRASAVLLVLAGAAPWVVACHALNWAIGGVIGPLNSVPEYLAWTGSPFSTNNMTGVMRHSPVKLVVYALSLLVGKHGLLNHNLPLLLCLPAALALLWRRSPFRPELLAGLLWCAATWGAYSLLSNNYSGASCSIRWFVPFLAPGFFLLAVYLKQQPRRVTDLGILTVWGSGLGLVMWITGPWPLRMIPGMWIFASGAVACWLGLALWRWRSATPVRQATLVRQAA